MIFIYLFTFLISCLVLARSGHWIIRALIRIARFLEWKEFIAASLLMAFATSLPELFVGILSALHKKPQLSFGNVIGSNIIMLTLATSIIVILTKSLKIRGRVLQKSCFYAPLIASVPLILIIDGYLSKTDGIILVLISIAYFSWLVRQKNGFVQAFSYKFKNKGNPFKIFLKNLLIFSGGIFLLLLASQGIVWSSMHLANMFNLPVLIIGLFLVAFGTSIPEIAFGIRSVKMNHKAMVLGNAMGSVVVNSTLVLGTTAIIYPFAISNFSPYFAGIAFTIITALLFAFFAKTDREITKKEAIILLAIYALFVITELVIK